MIDDRLKVTYKNDKARTDTNFLKRGCSISRFLSPESVDEILAMNPSEVIVAELDYNGDRMPANVVCGVGYRLLIVRSADSRIYSAVGEKYVGLSGYNKNILRTSELKSISIPYAFADIVDNLLREHIKARELPFFNASDMVKRFFDELNRQKIDNRRCDVFVSDGELISEGSHKDFLLMIAVMTALCLERSNHVSFTVENTAPQLVFRAICETESDFSDVFDYESEIGLFSYAIKLLAEANMWEFSFFSKGIKSGVELRTAHVHNGEELALFDEIVEFCSDVASKVLMFRQKGIEI